MNLSLSQQVPPWQSHLSSALAAQPNQSGGDQKGIIKNFCCSPMGETSRDNTGAKLHLKGGGEVRLLHFSKLGPFGCRELGAFHFRHEGEVIETQNWMDCKQNPEFEWIFKGEHWKCTQWVIISQITRLTSVHSLFEMNISLEISE